MATARIPVVLTYHKSGTEPPVFVAGTFSTPPWEPHEMEYTTKEDGEHHFKKEVLCEPGSTIQYKFRLGNGDWWVLDGNSPTVTDGAGNTNHVLEVKPLAEQNLAQNLETQQDTKPLSKHLRSVIDIEDGSGSRSGTPIFARTAAEVADSAASLHEEVPKRETPRIDSWSRDVRKGTPTPLSETAKTAAEVADSAETLDNDENTILILEQPPDEDVAFEVQGPGEEFLGDQDEYIADKSPLFAHECVGLYESSAEATPADTEPEDLAVGRAALGEIDADEIDPNDPTLERFPSEREDIMDTVRKLESGLQVDQPFDTGPPSPVYNVSRRGTEDITGDYTLTASQPLPLGQRVSIKPEAPRSSRTSVSSVPASISLHSISEAEEPIGEEEANFPPAVVFSNPDMKPRPKHLNLPSNNEDEGVVLPDGVSPRTVKPEQRRVVRPNDSPSPLNDDELVEAPADITSTTLDAHAAEGKVSPKSPESAGPGEVTSGEPAAPQPAPSASGTGTAMENGTDSGQLRRRGAQENPPKTSDSVHLTGVQTSQGGGWIRWLLNLLFVDLIGRLINKLTGRKTKTLSSADRMAVLVAIGIGLGVGYGWWTNAKQMIAQGVAR